ncbi:hypothetical protein CMI41_04825 [Candidatus Pacearchaeota archaeon]|jgi:Fe-S-cluster containining protein|nr:hypothetical protein [Candidatus Pacearchaeota archaeon]|tara:strand:- start:174 stop:539 length:366 start_codon:yes stop_codon:yes gene_type:complete
MEKIEFICKQCGACCRYFKKPVKNKEELIKLFENHFRFKLKSYDIEVLFKGECEHLEGNKCLIYKKRPKLCEDFFCERHVSKVVPEGQIYEKRCRVCQKIRKFQAGKERDKQYVCGDCWIW